MKLNTGKLLLIIMLLAVSVTAVCYSYKTKKEEPLDRLRLTLDGIGSVVPPGGNITLQPLGISNELPYWIRYILAPRYISQVYYRNDTVEVEREVNGQKRRMLRIVKAFRYDTALTVSPLAMPDSVLRGVIGSRRILWQNRDERYNYLLTAGH